VINVNGRSLVCSCGYFERHGLPCAHQFLILGPPKEEYIHVCWRTDYSFHYKRQGTDAALNASFVEALDNPPPGPRIVMERATLIAGQDAVSCYPLLHLATDMSFFSDILNSEQPVIINVCTPVVSGSGTKRTSNEGESRVIGGGCLSQEVYLLQEQSTIQDEDQEVVAANEASYSNAYANFTAHAARLSNVLQGRPHLVKKYSGLMSQLYSAAVKTRSSSRWEFCDIWPVGSTCELF
jgi:hypothetical protein